MDLTFELLLKAFTIGLGAWDTAQKNKYRDKILALQKIINDEEAKPIYSREDPHGITDIKQLRDQSKIDNAHIQLVVLLREFIRNEQPK